MKQYRILIMTVLLALTGRTLADNLAVEAVTIKPGETCQVAINLNNPEKAYSAFQFDLELPDGISIAKNDKGKYIVSLDADRKDDHTLDVSLKKEGRYRFMS